VAEVALAVYFARPVGVPAAELGRLWDRWRDRYPRTEDQPLLPPVIPETFNVPSFGFSMQFMAGQLGSRVWFVTKDGEQLVQVQPDRLIHNWRRTTIDEPYPRYELLRPAFADDVNDFSQFLVEQGLDRPSVLQAELTYVNPIPVAALGDSKLLGRLLAPWSGQYSDDFLPSPEDVRISIRYRINDPSSHEPVGRLYMDGAPALHQASEGEPEEVYMLQLFARGRPLGDDGVAGALAFLDLGHEWIVRGFTSMTTKTMHAEWGRQDADDV
jgi:uncharacterized protein (TIGR04255 family)